MTFHKDIIARAIREGRAAKGLTQQELADLAGISLRSVQRIEGGEVSPRAYTLRVLGEKLGISDWGASDSADPQPVEAAGGALGDRVARRFNKPQQIILTLGLGVLFFFGSVAFVAQSRRFPETQFEALLYWGGVILVYILVLFRIWR